MELGGVNTEHDLRVLSHKFDIFSRFLAVFSIYRALAVVERGKNIRMTRSNDGRLLGPISTSNR